MQSTVNGQKSTVQSGSSLGARPSTLRPHQLEFLAQVVTPALQSEREHGIPACITIAQAILESAARVSVTPAKAGVQVDSRLRGNDGYEWRWGASILFREANNPFGIKHLHHSGEEPYTEFDADTWEVTNGKIEHQRAAFERFPDLGSAFRAHAGLFLNSPRYKPAVAVLDSRLRGNDNAGGNDVKGGHPRESGDPAWKQFAVAIMNCGYSTDRPELCKQPGCPHYAGKLIKLVNDYRLNDARALGWYAEGEDPKQEVVSRQSAVKAVTDN